jgi:hypothetical protein
MHPTPLEHLFSEWRNRHPEIPYTPATKEQLVEFEEVHGPIPAEFREFLLVVGGGAVGSEWIDGIEGLRETHRKFKRECVPGGWTLTETFIIGWDGAGNPMGINEKSGAVVVEDHNFGGIHVLAPTFEEFLRRGWASSAA